MKDWLSKGAQPSVHGAAPAEGQGLRLAELVEYLARRLVDEPDAVRVEEVEREGDTVLAALRGAGRRRQGDRPPGPDRAGPAHGRPRVGGARGPARAPRDHGVARCASRRSTTSTETSPRSRPCLAEVEREGVDAIVFGGDLTWGPAAVARLDDRPLVAACPLRPRQRRPAEPDDMGAVAPAPRSDVDVAWLAACPMTPSSSTPSSTATRRPAATSEIVRRLTADEELAEILERRRAARRRRRSHAHAARPADRGRCASSTPGASGCRTRASSPPSGRWSTTARSS